MRGSGNEIGNDDEPRCFADVRADLNEYAHGCLISACEHASMRGSGNDDAAVATLRIAKQELKQ